MIQLLLTRTAAALLAALVLASPCQAAFSGTDVFLPSVGRAQGVATWYTTVWVHNRDTAPTLVQLTFLERDRDNTAAAPVTITIPAGDTARYANAMAELFGRDGFGAIRVTSSSKLLVSSRIYAKATGEGEKDSKGQLFDGIPASFAIGQGQTTTLLGVYLTQPSGSSEYRYNFGFVEVTGDDSCTVTVTPRDATGAALAAARFYTLRRLEQRQFQLKDEFPSLSTTNARLDVAVTAGPGRVLAFGSGIANASQDPTTFEMAFDDALLAENGSGSGTITGVTAGNGLTGGGTSGTVMLNVGSGVGITVGGDSVSLADGGVTKAKLAVTGAGTNGQVLGTDGSNLVWQSPSEGGLSYPYYHSGAEGATLFKITQTMDFGTAIYGESLSAASAVGVEGRAQAGTGVVGRSSSGSGVQGVTDSGVGVAGASLGQGDGVYGFAAFHQGDGLFGENMGTGTWGCIACHRNGFAYGGFFEGDVFVVGNLGVSGAKAFEIDHPLDPENRILSHFAVESPEVSNVYSGNVITDEHGIAVVELPDYFEALNRDFRYQLTVIGRFAQAIVEQEIAHNRFTIRTDLGRVKVSWQVTGTRNDPTIRRLAPPAEQDKPPEQRGFYLDPSAFGQGEEKSVERVRHPELFRRSPLTRVR